MKATDLKRGQFVFVDKPNSQFDDEEGKVLSVYSDYGENSDVVSIRLELDDATVLCGLKEHEVCI